MSGTVDRNPLLFLSHSGADTEAALRLAERTGNAPIAKENGLKVWIDKRSTSRLGLQAGTLWQQQLEEVISDRSTAFAVYLGARGVVNWVEAEVRLALSRATS